MRFSPTPVIRCRIRSICRKGWPHKVREVYLWGSEEPDTFLDITDTFTMKMDALYCHASQMKRPRAEREAGQSTLRRDWEEVVWNSPRRSSASKFSANTE